jgi:multidrug efflux pump subunit AcrA (membrane-fusion protein)
VSGTSRVYVVKDGKAEERIVTLGQKVDARIEVVTGLEDGELVVAEPRGRVTDGMLVRSSPSAEPGAAPSPSKGR